MSKNETDGPKHTPGPLNLADYNGRLFIEDQNGENVAEMLGVHDQRQMNADGRLFCAAPDLLAACEAAVQRYERMGPAESVSERDNRRNELDDLRAAIAKAKGGAA